MRVRFLDREEELRRLRRFLGSEQARLAVLYGRRRCGKSTLLQRICREGDLYYLAGEREAPLEIEALAAEGARLVPELAAARYPSWDALLRTLGARVTAPLTLLLDEFPYLVATSPELPSIIQHLVDRPGAQRLRFVLSGSSQRMMQGLVLDRTAPLYGRATEILKIGPLRAGWIPSALSVNGAEAVEAYAVWGGVPRYWELARERGSLEEAVRDLVLDRQGVLHDEPAGLLLDEMRTAGQSSSILALIGGGANRLSEIAARLSKPAGSLTRPLANLVELGYVRREVPFGEAERSTKRTLYRIDDPFLSFFFRFVEPNRSKLELGLVRQVEARMKAGLAAHVAGIWEDLARQSVPFLNIDGLEWDRASRWWGATPEGAAELDLVAESLDGRHILIGEAKWSIKSGQQDRWMERLRRRSAGLPFLRGRQVHHALWIPTASNEAKGIITAEQVLRSLRR